MTRERRFVQADVFSPEPGRGNALAVVVDAEDLTDEQMRRFAAWTNLAETTFVFPPTVPEADYRVRIMTPVREMPFAGHPTLGTCAAWLHCGGEPKVAGVVRQECGVGVVDIQLAQDPPAFIAPPTEIQDLPEQRERQLIERLGLQPSTIRRTCLLDNGPVWQVFELATVDDVLAVDSRRVNWATDKPIGLIAPTEPGADYDFEVRMVAPSSGMSEDPITGSLNSALAHWLDSLGRLDRRLVVRQGTNIDRLGRVFITPEQREGGAARVLIGGHSHILIDGTVLL